MTRGRLEAFSDGVIAIIIPIAFIAPLVAFGVYIFVAAMWIVPDPRIERRMAA